MAKIQLSGAAMIFILVVFPTIINFVDCRKYTRNLLIPARLSHSFNSAEGATLLVCTYLCSLAESCVGVSYHSGTMSCEFSNKTGDYFQTDTDGWLVYSAVIAKPYTFYKPCSVSEDCMDPNSRCVDNGLLVGAAKLCFCQPLFRFNHDTGRCEQVCSSLKDTFKRYPQATISGYDIGQTYEGIAVSGCKRKCVEHGDDCLSVDYGGSKCTLNSISFEDAEDAGVLVSVSRVYNRNCED